MDNKKIIIILAVIAVVLAAALAMAYLQTANAKQPTKIRITSDNTLYEGDTLKVKLTDLNGSCLSKQDVMISVKNSKGKVVLNKTVKTNSKGNAKLDLELKKGKYNVSATYGGNDNFTANSTTQNLTVKEVSTQIVSQETSSSGSGDYHYSQQYGTYVRQYTDSNGVQHIDSADGSSESFDPSTGILTYDDGNGHVDRSYMG